MYMPLLCVGGVLIDWLVCWRECELFRSLAVKLEKFASTNKMNKINCTRRRTYLKYYDTTYYKLQCTLCVAMQLNNEIIAEMLIIFE